MKLILILSFLSFGVFATLVCPDIRLDQPGEVMEKVPVQDQSLGICYAYAACQMADAQRAKVAIASGKTPSATVCSPLFAAVAETDHWSGKAKLNDKGNVDLPFEGGSLCKAYGSIQRNKVCPRDKLDDFLKDRGITAQKFFNKIYNIEQSMIRENKKISEKAANSFSGWDLLSPNSSWNKLQKKWDEEAVCSKNHLDQFYNMLAGIFGAMTPAYAIVEKYFSEDMLNEPFDVAMIFNFICLPKERISQPYFPTCKDTYWGDAKKIYSQNPFSHLIVNQLRGKKMPVGISYCSNLFDKKDGGKSFDGIKSRKGNSTEYYPKETPKECGNHASLVIGSKFNKTTKRCDFLIRNTWGTGCKSYHSDFKCEGGNIWVDQDTLERNTYRIQRL